MTERLFRFNPFLIKQWDEKEVIEQYSILEDSLLFSDTPFELAKDIDIYANMGYLMGEMIARYYMIVSDLETKLKVDIANTIYRERNQFSKINAEKVPAMSYFEAIAQSMYLNDTKTLTEKEANLKRFKYAYESIESKQNALKKKLEAIKFDTIGR